MLSLKKIATECLSLSLPVSVLKDVFERRNSPLSPREVLSLKHRMLDAMAPIREIPFRPGRNGYKFINFKEGNPGFDTFVDTFGFKEILWELKPAPFGDLELPMAYFNFYVLFLSGQTGAAFCSACSSTALKRFLNGTGDVYGDGKEGSGNGGVEKNDILKELTVAQGRILSKEMLTELGDQCAEIDRIEKTFNFVEMAFKMFPAGLATPILFFLPAGEVLDPENLSKLGLTHAVVPYKIVYPGCLDRGGTTKLYIYDCNSPGIEDCYIEFIERGGVLDFRYNGVYVYDSTSGWTWA